MPAEVECHDTLPFYNKIEIMHCCETPKNVRSPEEAPKGLASAFKGREPISVEDVTEEELL